VHVSCRLILLVSALAAVGTANPTLHHSTRPSWACSPVSTSVFLTSTRHIPLQLANPHRYFNILFDIALLYLKPALLYLKPALQVVLSALTPSANNYNYVPASQTRMKETRLRPTLLEYARIRPPDRCIWDQTVEIEPEHIDFSPASCLA